MPQYACVDPDGPGEIASCTRPGGATGPIDTSAVGRIAFTVDAEDLAGNKASKTVWYIVDPAPPPGNLSDLIASLAPGPGERVPRGTMPTFEVVSSCTGMDLHASVSPSGALDDERGFLDAREQFPMLETSSGSGTYRGVPHGDWLQQPGLYYWEVRAVARCTRSAPTTWVSEAVPFQIVGTSAPDITISTPADAGRYRRGEVVLADYACSDTDGASDVKSCTGPAARGAALDTSTAGARSFTVIAEDQSGRTTTKTVDYVIDGSAPQITVTTPAEGGIYLRGAQVIADFACRDEDGSEDIKTCDGPVAPGAAIATTAAGPMSFTVIGSDRAGNRVVRTVTYRVVEWNLQSVTSPTSVPPLPRRPALLVSVRAAGAGALRLVFRIPSPGVLVVRASTTTGAARRTVTYAKLRRSVVAGAMGVTLTPTPQARRLLAHNKTLKLKLRSVFAPHGGGKAIVLHRSLTVKRTR